MALVPSAVGGWCHAESRLQSCTAGTVRRAGWESVTQGGQVMLTTKYVPGAPNWVDLGTPDIDAAARFYGALFGWQFQSAGPDAGGYGMFTLGGKTVAAAGPLMDQGAPPSWTLYFPTPDPNATPGAGQPGGREIPAR